MTRKEIMDRIREIKGKVQWDDTLSYEEKQELLKEEYYLRIELNKLGGN